MFKMTVIYKVPADVNAFADWYKGHTELAKKVPLTKEIRISKIIAPRKEPIVIMSAIFHQRFGAKATDATVKGAIGTIKRM